MLTSPVPPPEPAPAPRRRARGQVLVLFALLLPALMAVTLGVLDLWQVLATREALHRAATVAARAGADALAEDAWRGTSRLRQHAEHAAGVARFAAVASLGPGGRVEAVDVTDRAVTVAVSRPVALTLLGARTVHASATASPGLTR